MDKWKQCMKIFFVQHICSYRMLSVAVVSLICMDIYARPIRRLCSLHNVKVSLLGMPIFWNRHHVAVLFILIFLFAITEFPLDRRTHQYMIARLGVRLWLLFQATYLMVFCGIYALWCYAIFVITLCPYGSYQLGYYQGWWRLSELQVKDEMNTGIQVSQEYLLSHGTLQANAEFILCLWLVLLFIGMALLLFNQLRPYLGDVLACFIILSGISNKVTGMRTWFSPMHFLSMSNRYSVVHPQNPRLLYMILVLATLNMLLYYLADGWICSTQENNRRIN